MKKNLKKILACTLVLSTLCAVSPVNISADSEYVYTDEFVEFLLNCEPIQILSDNCYTVMIDKSYDENGDVVYKNQISCLEKINILGFQSDGIAIEGDMNERIIWIDENGVPKIIETISLGKNENSDIYYSTIDFETGEKIILLVGENLGDGKCEIVARCGDTNCDGTVDVRDVTAINQHIIKANILPDYADTVADVNDDGNIDISDLGMLKKYIIKMIDSF